MAIPLIDHDAGPAEPASTIAAVRDALPEELCGQFQNELDEAIDQALEQNDKTPIDRVKARWLTQSKTPGEA